MNAIYSGCIIDPWVEVAEQLDIKHNIKPVYWIGWNTDKEIIENKFYDCVFQDFNSAWRGVFSNVDKSHAYLDGDILNKYSSEELIAMKMMDRQDTTGYNFSFNERQQFFRHLLRSWMFIIEKYNVEVVISPSIPHRVFDYALYVASKVKEINFISFKMTAWPGHLIPINKIDEIPLFTNIDNKKNLQVTDFIKKTKSDYLLAEPYYMKAQNESKSNFFLKMISSFFNKGNVIKKTLNLFNDANSYWKLKGRALQNNKINYIQRFFVLKKGRTFKNKLEKTYNLKCIPPDFDLKYVFIALHYQPEETSSPSGHVYVDQGLMIETLLKNLPKDVFLFVKEHSSQFHPLMEGETGRSLGFYDQLLKFNRVKLIPTNINSFELIDNSTAVATLTGTVGVEALIRNKPVLVFGTAWYENLPGIFSVKKIKDLKSILTEIGNSNISDATTKNELNNIFNNSVKAYHYGNYKETSGLEEKNTILNLITSIENMLNL